jgi:hypothetical protein
VINTSSASLSLNRDDEIQNAYPIGLDLDFDFVKLNDQDIIAQRTFAVTQGSSGLPFLALLQI